MEIIFWTAVCVILYTYLVYALIIYLGLIFLRKANQKNIPQDYDWPTVSILVACYNEEDFLQSKIENLLKLDYPENKLEIVFVTDGSTDRSNEIIESYLDDNAAVKYFYEPERKGKQHAVDRVMPLLMGDIVVFNDCNTWINPEALKRITIHFHDPDIGVVTGEKKIRFMKLDEAVSSGEGMYWKYESFLKRMDSEFYSAVGSPGELFAIRRKLYEAVPAEVSIEDFYLSMKIVLKGYRNVYEPGAWAEEYASASVEDEFKRKRRIASGAFQTMKRLRSIYALKHWKILFLYISHRVMRWTLAPLGLVIAFISNLFLEGAFYSTLLWLQIIFYTLAFAGYLLRNYRIRFNLLYIPFYFVFMNLALAFGFMDFLKGKNNVVWEKVNRKLN